MDIKDDKETGTEFVIDCFNTWKKKYQETFLIVFNMFNDLFEILDWCSFIFCICLIRNVIDL